MTDKDYNLTKRRIQALVKKWIKPLGLNTWKVEIQYCRAGIEGDAKDKADNFEVKARCYAQWRYLTALIEFNMLAAFALSDAELEETFVHECMHVFVNEMRMWNEDHGIDHEERVVSQLTSAMLGVRAAGKVVVKQRKGKHRASRNPAARSS